MFSRAAFFAFASLGFATTAQAGVVTTLEGNASVNRGQGYVPVALGTQLKAGDRLLVGRSSQAKISFSQDCTITLSEGQIVTVSATSPCSDSRISQSDFSGRSGVFSSPSGYGFQNDEHRKVVAFGLLTAGVVGATIYVATQTGGNDAPRSASP